MSRLSSSRARLAARRAAMVAVLSIAGLFGAPAVLLAHAHLTRSEPTSGARLSASPASIRLWFSEAPELAFTKIRLFGADSSEIALGVVSRAPGQPLGVSAAIASPLAPGQYIVEWRTAAADGHPSHGRFSFTVLTPQGSMTPMTSPSAPTTGAHTQMMQRHTQGQPHAMGSLDDGGLGAESIAYVIVRWVSFTALLALIGVAVLYWLVLPGTVRLADSYGRGDSARAIRMTVSRRAAWLGVLASAALAIADIARLYVQSSAIHGVAGAMNHAMLQEMVTQTTWGSAWLLQAVTAVVAVVALAAAMRGPAGAARRAAVPWAIATTAILVLAFTPALGGHAAAPPRLTTLAVVADALHVLGAGGWLGTLLALVTVAVPAVLATSSVERGGIVADFINAFSPPALGFASLVVLTGVFAGWLHIGSLAALWNSSYGKTLLLKVALLVPVLGTGAYNWRRVRPRLGDVAAARHLRRSATMELVIGAMVVGVTAVLVALQTPM